MYWYALARDVPFARYATDPLIAQAAADLSRLSAFRGPKAGGAVTPATIFRLGLAGEMSGPYVSQFQWLPVPYGVLAMDQRYPIAPPAEFMTTYDAWLDRAERHHHPTATPAKAPVSAGAAPRYIEHRARYGHVSHRRLRLSGLSQRDADPGRHGRAGRTKAIRTHQSKTQVGIATFGTAFHGLDLVAKVANAALKAVHYQKWLVHRRLRPEEFGGRVHNHMTKAAQYPIHTDLLSTSTVLDAVFQKHGTYLLPMPVPRGCPHAPVVPGSTRGRSPGPASRCSKRGSTSRTCCPPRSWPVPTGAVCCPIREHR